MELDGTDADPHAHAEASSQLAAGSALVLESVPRVFPWLPRLPVELPEARAALKQAVALRPRWGLAHALLAAHCFAFPPEDPGCAEHHAAVGLNESEGSAEAQEVGLLVQANIIINRAPVCTVCRGACDEGHIYQARLGVKRPIRPAERFCTARLVKNRNVLLARASRRLHRLLQENPTHAEAWFALAKAFPSDDAMALHARRKALQFSPKSGRLHFELVAHLRNLGRRREADEAIATAVSAGMFRVPYNRPWRRWPALQPETLPADAALEGAVHVMQSHFAEIYDELVTKGGARTALTFPAAACPPDSVCRIPGVVELGNFKGLWEEGHIYNAPTMRRKFSRKSCDKKLPRTCAALEEAFSGTGLFMGRVSLSVVHSPRTFIAPHGSPMQGLWRMHCVVLLYEDAVSQLRLAPNLTIQHQGEGQCFWFDESVEHSAWYSHPGGGPRMLLIADVLRREIAEGRAGEMVSEARPFAPAYWADKYFSRHVQAAGREPA